MIKPPTTNREPWAENTFFAIVSLHWPTTIFLLRKNIKKHCRSISKEFLAIPIKKRMVSEATPVQTKNREFASAAKKRCHLFSLLLPWFFLNRCSLEQPPTSRSSVSDFYCCCCFSLGNKCEHPVRSAAVRLYVTYRAGIFPSAVSTVSHFLHMFCNGRNLRRTGRPHISILFCTVVLPCEMKRYGEQYPTHTKNSNTAHAGVAMTIKVGETVETSKLQKTGQNVGRQGKVNSRNWSSRCCSDWEVQPPPGKVRLRFNSIWQKRSIRTGAESRVD